MGKRRNGYPIRLEKWYERQICKLVRAWQKDASDMLVSYLKPYVVGGTKVLADAANDDPNWHDGVQQALKLFATQMDTEKDEQTIESIVKRWLITVDNFSKKKAEKYASTAKVEIGTVGLNPLKDDPTLQNYTKSKIAENTSLIKTMKRRYTDQLQNDIYRSVTNGGGVTDISHAINYRTGMSLRHAGLIAVDQTGKALSQLDAYRSKQAGFTKYIWRSMGDGRVRPKHQDLDGQTFKYNDSSGGDNGQLPGEPIRCRCYAEPVE